MGKTRGSWERLEQEQQKSSASIYVDLNWDGKGGHSVGGTPKPQRQSNSLATDWILRVRDGEEPRYFKGFKPGLLPR